MKRPSGVAGITVMGVMQFERFFRLTAIFDVDKQEGAQRRHRNSVPRIARSFSVALARSFKVIDPTTKNPATREWERAFQLSGLLL